MAQQRPVLFLATAPLLGVGVAAGPWAPAAGVPGGPPGAEPSYQIIPLTFEQLYTLIRWLSPTRFFEPGLAGDYVLTADIRP